MGSAQDQMMQQMMQQQPQGMPMMEDIPRSVAEHYIYFLRKSIHEQGSMALRSLFSAVDCATTMLGSIMVDQNTPKYPMDGDGKFLDPVLNKVLNDLYEDAIMPDMVGNFAGANGAVDIEVGKGYVMRGTIETAQLITHQAEQYMFEVAVRKCQAIIAPLSALLGREGMLPPHTALAEIGQERTLQAVIKADAGLREQVYELAEELAMNRFYQLLQDNGIELEEDAQNPEEQEEIDNDPMQEQPEQDPGADDYEEEALPEDEKEFDPFDEVADDEDDGGDGNG